MSFIAKAKRSGPTPEDIKYQKIIQASLSRDKYKTRSDMHPNDIPDMVQLSKTFMEGTSESIRVEKDKRRVLAIARSIETLKKFSEDLIAIFDMQNLANDGSTKFDNAWKQTDILDVMNGKYNNGYSEDQFVFESTPSFDGETASPPIDPKTFKYSGPMKNIMLSSGVELPELAKSPAFTNLLKARDMLDQNPQDEDALSLLKEAQKTLARQQHALVVVHSRLNRLDKQSEEKVLSATQLYDNTMQFTTEDALLIQNAAQRERHTLVSQNIAKLRAQDRAREQLLAT